MDRKRKVLEPFLGFTQTFVADADVAYNSRFKKLTTILHNVQMEGFEGIYCDHLWLTTNLYKYGKIKIQGTIKIYTRRNKSQDYTLYNPHFIYYVLD